MNNNPHIALIGTAIADRSRSRMLCQLMNGRALTNKELAIVAGITPQTASFHLRHLQNCGLISTLKSGRCVYYKIANEMVAELLERVACLSPTDHVRRHTKLSKDICSARTCYNHIAGRLGVAIKERLVNMNVIQLFDDTAQVCGQGAMFLSDLGMHIGKGLRAKLCLDWTERKYHLSGPLATELLRHFMKQGWTQQCDHTRAIKQTNEGLLILECKFKISPQDIFEHSDAPEDTWTKST